jgi:hypothetical protein
MKSFASTAAQTYVVGNNPNDSGFRVLKFGGMDLVK